MGANSTQQDGQIVEVTFGAVHDTKWQMSVDVAGAYNGGKSGAPEYYVCSINWEANADADILKVRNGGAVEAKIFRAKAAGGVQDYVKYFNPPLPCDPYVLVADCTSAASTILTFRLVPPEVARKLYGYAEPR